MSTVARTIICVPERSASDTWAIIVSLIAPDPTSPARRELASVAGVACTCIADTALETDALIVHGVGPRPRVYALYGDDAITGEGANESVLSWIPTDGDWRMSIPCLSDDFAWVQASLTQSSLRVTARPLGTTVEPGEEDAMPLSTAREDAGPIVDLDDFLRG